MSEKTIGPARPGRQLLLLAAMAAALLIGMALAVRAAARLEDVFVWSADWDGFGGFSAIELTPDGSGFVALSDRALLVTGQITRRNGQITSITVTDRAALLDPSGNAMSQLRGDSEGLAVALDGTIFISFEGVARIRLQDGLHGEPSLLPGHPNFARMGRNLALESLAIDADGALYTIPEAGRPPGAPFPVYRLKDGIWSVPFQITPQGPFLVSGADIGPDGLLYVLERDFSGFNFRSRVRRFAPDGSGEVTVLETGAGELGNMEGISIWQDAEGLRMTLIGDDNFSFLQSTEIAEFRLD